MPADPTLEMIEQAEAIVRAWDQVARDGWLAAHAAGTCDGGPDEIDLAALAQDVARALTEVAGERDREVARLRGLLDDWVREYGRWVDKNIEQSSYGTAKLIPHREVLEKENEEFRAQLAERDRLIAALRAALQRISEGRGRFSRDQQEFANNVIEESKQIALDALAFAPVTLREQEEAERAVINAAFTVSMDLAQDCAGDPRGWHERKLAGWCRISLHTSNALRDALAALAALTAAERPAGGGV